MYLFLLVICFQDLTLDRSESWENLARPWMTAAETALFDRLDAREQKEFRGYFVARRQENPSLWPESGNYLPPFFCAKPHGDIRDQIAFLLGEPETAQPHPLNPELPRSWRYGELELSFEPKGANVKLSTQGRTQWDALMQKMIKHPEIRYDFRVKSFGRTRLPEGLLWSESTVENHWVTPEADGGNLQVTIAIPASFKDYLRETKANPVQHMELLLLLRREDGRGGLQQEERLRHASQRLNLLEADFFNFDSYLPAGFFQVEFLIYSGFLDRGIKAREKVLVRPPELARIGDPVICQDWEKAAIAMPDEWVFPVGDYFYKPSPHYNPEKLGLVLVQSTFKNTRAMLQTEGEQPRDLTLLRNQDGWFVFTLPPQATPFRLLALGAPEGENILALSGTGPLFGQPADQGLTFKQKNAPNYLNLEVLDIDSTDGPTLLFVNGRPLSASRVGRFPWPSMDWGRRAELRFEYERGGQWRASRFELPRSEVFEEIRVKPKYLVAAAQNLEGLVESVDFQISMEGRPMEVLKKTTLSPVPKLWGVVVNDPLLKSASWPLIRHALAAWLTQNTHDRDMVYIVHNSHRPQLMLAPTTYKPLVNATLHALQPQTSDEHYFTLKYLIDALTHLKQHQTRPHQVLLLTDQLTDEVQQMENLIPVFRQTGLQMYNLEFPFEFIPGTEAKLAGEKVDPLVTMAIREETDQRDRLGTRDSFQEARNVTTPLYSFRFGGKKKKDQERKREQLRAEAFHGAFNQQLATLTAGLAHTSAPGQTVQSLHQFFDKLSLWQEHLVHLELPVLNLKEGGLSVRGPEGYSTSWTLVEWRPELL